MTNAFFVYGTLKRSQCRAQLWPSPPLSVQAAWTFGTLFGRADYPAVTPGRDRVLGELWLFAEPEVLQVLQTLDQIEGTNQPEQQDLYLRRLVDVWTIEAEIPHRAYMYLYARDPIADGFTLIVPSGPQAGVQWLVDSDSILQ